MSRNTSQKKRSTDERLELAEDDIETLMWEVQVLEGGNDQHEERLRELEAAVVEFDERLARLEDENVS